ncbi:DUF6361 family protein [Peribacillus sp. Hz7]|uniref:DUF6361 family protein n=1 Tax=Peribacillus sp. Hz7 TaxID=3344873 RepID=UPI0035CC0DE8
MLQIGWIDFSSDHRDKVMTILDSLKEQGAVDELGIGTIRDRLSDYLFPGISTIQTRAKYLLLIPWIIQYLESRNVTSKNFIKQLHELEYKFIDVLSEGNNELGIIGRDSRGDLQRKPSSVYWYALRKYKICKLDVTLNQYAELLDEVIANKLKTTQELKAAEKDQLGDDRDAILDNRFQSFWNVCPPPEKWMETLSIHLAKREAEFLRETIRLAVPHSLLAHLLSLNHLHKVDDFKSIEAVTAILPRLPEELKQMFQLALDFAQIMYGANIRFNVIFNKLNDRTNEIVEDRWEQWCHHMKNEFLFERWDTTVLFHKTNPDDATRTFVKRWIDFVKSRDYDYTDEIDEWIRKREVYLKGGRAKLRINHQANNQWIGLGKLTYRWSNVKTILEDIKRGLESNV